MTIICGTAGRCDRHERALYGYPCHACAEEYWRRYPRTRELIHRQASGEGPVIRPSQITAARKRDQEDRAAYEGPHRTTIERAGEYGPVARLWNTYCTDGCGWSHYWLRSKQAAQDAADAHQCPAFSRTPQGLTVRCDLLTDPAHTDHEHWATGPSVLAGHLWGST